MNVVALVLRVVLGGVFIVAGGSKIGHAGYFAAQIAAFHLVPQPLIAPMALLLPFLEVLLGGYLVIGLYTRLAGWIAAIQLLIFAAAISSAVMRGMVISCGCFGPNDQTVTSWPEVARDLALALAALVVALRGPGMLALDRRISSKP
ncbi:MAG: MauE/DoxX family redox-associated membrane protein [Candidatus Velthaea sp.]|jgi:uncharacterized membrane protein YphA (DoxX/SURF4 family)